MAAPLMQLMAAPLTTSTQVHFSLFFDNKHEKLCILNACDFVVTRQW